MNLVLQLAPGYTVTLQPYTLSDVAVGSPISPSSVSGSLYTFNLSDLAAGDYNMRLLGNWQINGQAFPCRKTASAIYIADYWWQINAAIVNGTPVTPSPIAGLCNVIVSATFNGRAVSGGPVHCTLDGNNNTVDGFLVSRAVESGVTDSSGNCILTLIQFGQFTRGGIYRLKVSDAYGKCLHDRKVKIPNTPTANAEDLEDA